MESSSNGSDNSKNEQLFNNESKKEEKEDSKSLRNIMDNYDLNSKKKEHKTSGKDNSKSSSSDNPQFTEYNIFNSEGKYKIIYKF